MKKKYTYIEKFQQIINKYSPIINFTGYLLALATLIITAHSAISSRKALDLAILEYQESLLPTWKWTINDSTNTLTISSPDLQIEVEDVCAYFPTKIVGPNYELNSYPEDISLHTIMLKSCVERYLERLFNDIQIGEEEILCSSIGIPIYMQITYIHKGQRKVVKEIYSLRCDIVYDIEQPIQTRFSKLYLENYLQHDINGQEEIDKLFENLIKEYKKRIKKNK